MSLSDNSGTVSDCIALKVTRVAFCYIYMDSKIYHLKKAIEGGSKLNIS